MIHFARGANRCVCGARAVHVDGLCDAVAVHVRCRCGADAGARRVDAQLTRRTDGADRRPPSDGAGPRA